MTDSGLAAIKGGSGLAHEEVGTFNVDVDWPDAFASKPAPTGDCLWMKNSGLTAIKGGSGLAHEGAGTFNIDGD